MINKLKGKTEPLLFGMHLCPNGNKKLYITEGEIDCLTVSQIFDNKYPVVSIPNGVQGAVKAIKYNLEWINKFDEIVLVFDMDEPGRKAVEESAQLLPVGKAKIAVLPYKDPNEMLKKGLTKELENLLWRAREYRPDGIVYGGELWEEIKKPVQWGLPYPFPTLTKLTYGLKTPEYIILGAGTGIGKTTYFTAIEAHFIKNTDKKIGIIHLEQQIKTTCLYLMAQIAQKPLFKPDCEIKEKELEKYFNETLNNKRVFFYNAFGTRDFDTIKNIIRYLVIKQECKIVFLDHISAIASGIKAGTTDINQTMKNVSSEFASLTRELSFNLFAISHLRKSTTKSWENGAKPTLDDFEGSGDITKWADFVFAISRNKNAQGENKNISQLHCLKDRFTGEADGATISLLYNPKTCQLCETIKEGENEEYQDNEDI